jgi:hypothetical protein
MGYHCSAIAPQQFLYCPNGKAIVAIILPSMKYLPKLENSIKYRKGEKRRPFDGFKRHIVKCVYNKRQPPDGKLA